MSQLIEVKVPDIGDFKNVEVIEVLVKPGDTVKKEDSLISLESDKAAMEVPSSHNGVVKELKLKVGDKVSAGSLVLVLETTAMPKEEIAPGPLLTTGEAVVAKAAASSAVSAATASMIAPVAAAAPYPATAQVSSDHHDHVPHASPAIRAFARELGVELAKVKGTAPKGRITKEDVQSFVKSELAQPKGGAGGALAFAQMAYIDFSKFGAVETRALSRIKKLSGAHLHRNWVGIPHVTQFDEADITEAEAFRVKTNEEIAKSGAKVTLLAFLIKACVASLKKFPEFNASLEAGGENLVLKKYFNIGFAADTPNGLVVPVIKDADKKSVIDLAREAGELAAKAREGKLSSAEMQGGCLSISSLGGIGGSYFTPIINAPEVAILGVSKAQTKPIWDGKEFAPRLILPLSLSYDHRVIDGAAAARFTVHLCALMSDIRRLVL